MRARSTTVLIAAAAVGVSAALAGAAGASGVQAAGGSFVGPAYPADAPDCFPVIKGKRQESGLVPQMWQAVAGLPVPVQGTPKPQRLVLGERGQLADAQGVAQLLAVCGLRAVTLQQVGQGKRNGGEATLDAAIAASALPASTQLVIASSTAKGWTGVIKATAAACGVDTSMVTWRLKAAGEPAPTWPSGGCIISVSYGEPDIQVFGKGGPSADTLRAIQMMDQLTQLGVVMVFSAGDESSGGCSPNPHAAPTGLTSRFPSSHPGALAVAGTQWDSQAQSMTQGRKIPYVPGATYTQNVWKDSKSSPKCANWPSPSNPQGASGTGGGQSSYFALPGYQQAVVSVNYPQNVGRRLTPDLAALAEWPTYALIRNGAWELNGGTSAAAPSVAVGIANANAALSARGLPVIDNGGGARDIHTIVYSPAYSSALTDVTAGDNDLFGLKGSSVMPGYNDAVPAWQALAGYDMASGMGVPNFTVLARLLGNR
jgi:hypothetical protein